MPLSHVSTNAAKKSYLIVFVSLKAAARKCKQKLNLFCRKRELKSGLQCGSMNFLNGDANSFFGRARGHKNRKVSENLSNSCFFGRLRKTPNKISADHTNQFVKLAFTQTTVRRPQKQRHSSTLAKCSFALFTDFCVYPANFDWLTGRSI